MYLDGLDALDQKIVQLLIENARISYSDIGEKIGISRVAVKARIQTLEQKGIIEEYTTVINPQKISGAVSCYFEIETTPDCLAQVTQILNRHDTVTQIYRVTRRGKPHYSGAGISCMFTPWRLLQRKWKPFCTQSSTPCPVCRAAAAI